MGMIILMLLVFVWLCAEVWVKCHTYSSPCTLALDRRKAPGSGQFHISGASSASPLLETLLALTEYSESASSACWETVTHTWIHLGRLTPSNTTTGPEAEIGCFFFFFVLLGVDMFLLCQLVHWPAAENMTLFLQSQIKICHTWNYIWMILKRTYACMHAKMNSRWSYTCNT